MYDFETLRPRYENGAEKWAALAASSFCAAPEVIPFSVADMEFQTAPEIINALQERTAFGVYGYTMADGTYLDAVVRWMGERHQWEVDPHWIVETYGVVSAMGSVIRAFTEPMDGVLIQPPVYPPFRRLVRDNGRTLVTNPLKWVNGHYEMDFADLEEKAALPSTKLMLLCSPHNPVGRVWTREELQKVGEICNRHNVLVFSDEIHFDFVAKGHEHTVFATLSEACKDNCVIGTAASKSFNLAGLATSNIIIPNADRCKAFHDQYRRDAGEFNNYFGLAATKAAYEHGADWLEALNEYLAENEQFCRTYLNEHFPEVKVAPCEGTYLLWADFSSFGLEPKALERFMVEQAGLFLDEGYIFGSEGAGFERINFACPRRYLEWGLQRLQQAAKEAGLLRI